MTPQESNASYPECGKFYGKTDWIGNQLIRKNEGEVEECSRLKVT